MSAPPPLPSAGAAKPPRGTARFLQDIVFVLLVLVLVLSAVLLAIFSVGLVLFNDTGKDLTTADFFWPITDGPLQILLWLSLALAGAWVGLGLVRKFPRPR